MYLPSIFFLENPELTDTAAHLQLPGYFDTKATPRSYGFRPLFERSVIETLMADTALQFPLRWEGEFLVGSDAETEWEASIEPEWIQVEGKAEPVRVWAMDALGWCWDEHPAAELTYGDAVGLYHAFRNFKHAGHLLYKNLENFQAAASLSEAYPFPESFGDTMAKLIKWCETSMKEIHDETKNY